MCSSFKWQSMPATRWGVSYAAAPFSCFERVPAHPPACCHLSEGRAGGDVGQPPSAGCCARALPTLPPCGTRHARASLRRTCCQQPAWWWRTAVFGSASFFKAVCNLSPQGQSTSKWEHWGLPLFLSFLFYPWQCLCQICPSFFGFLAPDGAALEEPVEASTALPCLHTCVFQHSFSRINSAYTHASWVAKQICRLLEEALQLWTHKVSGRPQIPNGCYLLLLKTLIVTSALLKQANSPDKWIMNNEMFCCYEEVASLR